ncbi:hypothetical protein M011DRAFT_525295 [Sporormia fimetaria CBS 119925]|uniref:Uncharacterized protein n=1 Tax=Sporormia fimetaria CBS 119925 TaxID=1340428 RepID=A0A6A6VEY1_9PLEO|nr:hypothetical protein M011DRAFT_525295 [Sporormia fimetaria CBS 119925]
METIFIPLMLNFLGPLAPISWTRRYMPDCGSLRGLPAVVIGREEDVTWDCVCEMRYRDELHLQQQLARLNEPDVAERLEEEEEEEEERFCVREELRILIMEVFGD